MRFPVSLFMVGVIVRLEAQELVRGVVLDAGSRAPVPSASVMVAGSDRGVLSSMDGQFSVRLGASRKLIVRHLAYLPDTIQVPAETEWTEVLLQPDVRALPMLSVHPSGPETVFADDTLHAALFEPGADGLWVLAYRKPRMWRDQARAGREILRGPLLVLLDTALNEIAREPVPGECTGLHIGRQGEAYVLGTTKAFACEFVDRRIVLHDVRLADVHALVMSWTDTLNGRWLGNDRDTTYPAFDHLAYDPMDSSMVAFHHAEDTFTMELFRSQYKYMSGHDKVIASDLEARTGIDREIIAGFMTGFHEDLYFHMPYAPMFVRHDTVLVFDHASGKLCRYDPDLKPCGTARLEYAEGTSAKPWTEQLLFDPEQEEVYALYERNGRVWLRHLHAATAEAGTDLPIAVRYPERVRVYAGHVYYIYRPFESMRKRTLYREPLGVPFTRPMSAEARSE